ncbi:MAG: response regulator [Desulfobacterales bacterium]|nr:response regulator [Desulfobacterales bacterium]
MMEKPPLIFIVDDDPDVRLALSRLIDSVELDFETFASADEFLLRKLPNRPCCLILDIRMPGLNGLELQEELVKREHAIPIVFITGHGDIPMSVKAMKKGAVDFLPKPFDEEDLLSAVDKAIAKSDQMRKSELEKANVQGLLQALTPREHEVMRWVITGMLNKQIARTLDISEKTVKFHRAHIMEKMQVESVAELVRLTQKADILPANE